MLTRLPQYLKQPFQPHWSDQCTPAEAIPKSLWGNPAGAATGTPLRPRAQR